MAKSRGLGKGLDALFSGFDEEETKEGIMELKLTEIEPDKNQPRSSFDEEKLSELANSIKTHGVLQPIIVTKMENGFYKIIAGERRWRAAKIAKLKTIPAIVKNLSEKEISELSLIENLQREDLNPIEEAMGYKNLIEKYNYTQEMLSERIGKSRSAIANALRLTNLSEEVKKYVSGGLLSAGHARALLALEGSAQEECAKIVIKEGLSVRETEKLVKNFNFPKRKKEKKEKNIHDMEIERRLSEALKTKVQIQKGAKKGLITIEFYSEDELSRIIDLIT
ncbi:MAG: ParB/RepB/Spo0J family partition protein [Clostridiaceae bacterium]|nr:ParB/RepB/Spo0J family partition protein [Clostridiaceae bacterium]